MVANALGQETRGVAAVAEYVAHNGAVDARMLGCGEQKEGVDARHLSVALRNGTFELKVGRCAEPSQDVGAVHLPRKVHSETIVGCHRDSGLISKDRVDKLNALLAREEAMLVGIEAYGHNYLVEQIQGSQHNVLVTHGEGVERAREYGSFGVGLQCGKVLFYLKRILRAANALIFSSKSPWRKRDMFVVPYLRSL